MDMSDSKKIEEKDRRAELSCELAAGMLWEDRSFLVPLYLILVAPLYLSLLSDAAIASTTRILISTLLELVFFYIIGARWIPRFRKEGKAVVSGALQKIVIVGFAIWLFLAIPAFAVESITSTVSNSPFGFLILISLLFCLILRLQYHFYALPLLFTKLSILDSLKFARKYTKANGLFKLNSLPIRVIIPSFSVMFLLANLVILPAPDERYLATTILSYFTSGAMLVLTAYLTLAFGLVYLSKEDWKENDFLENRVASLETAALKSPSWLSFILSAKGSMLVLLVGIMIWFGAVYIKVFTPPTFAIAEHAVELEEKSIWVSLDLSDSEFNFRGFNPYNFGIGEEGATQPPLRPKNYLLNQDPTLHNVPTSSSEVIVELEFVTNRTAEENLELENQKLFYYHVPLIPIEFTVAEEAFEEG